MSLPGRYFSERDIGFINGINDELLGDVIQTEVLIYAVCPEQTRINIYGESSPSSGKVFYPPVEVICLVDRADITTDADDFGPERKQNVAFKFMEKDLQEVDLFPQTGDIIFFNDRYHEITDVVQEQFLGGIPDKSFSIIVNTHYTSISKVDLVERQS
ncbi:MAG TPA: hypothetical protein PKX15_01000 [Bacteroidales bacterium]|nr:hypothetical protein [Bacteroidales bacterium]